MNGSGKSSEISRPNWSLEATEGFKFGELDSKFGELDFKFGELGSKFTELASKFPELGLRLTELGSGLATDTSNTGGNPGPKTSSGVIVSVPISR